MSTEPLRSPTMAVFIACVAMAALLAVCWLYSRDDRPSEIERRQTVSADDRAASPPGDPGGSASSREPAKSPSVESISVAPTTVELSVSGPKDEPVHRAFVFDASEIENEQVLVTSRALATTDESGRAVVEVGSGRDVCIVARGYRPKDIRIVDVARGPVEVTLERGARVALHCVDVAGAPVANVSVVATLAETPRFTSDAVLFEREDLIISGRGSSALWFERSDESGEIVLSGLPDGLMRVLATQPDHVVMESDSELILVNGDTRAEIVLAPVLGCAVKFIGDDVLSTKMFGSTTKSAEPTPASFRCLMITAQLERRTGADLAVAIAFEDGIPEPSPTRTLEIEGASVGRLNFEIPLQRPSEVVEATTIDHSAYPKSARRGKQMTLSLIDAAGARLDGRYILRREGTRSPPVLGTFGKPVPLRFGTYTIRLNDVVDPTLRERRIIVSESGADQFTIESEAVLRRIRLGRKRSAVIDLSTMRWIGLRSGSGEEISSMAEFSSISPRLLVPLGHYQVYERLNDVPCDVGTIVVDASTVADAVFPILE